MLENLNLSKEVVIKGKTFPIKDITPGDVIDIESNKHFFSNGKYAEILKTPSKTSLLVSDIIDACATITVLLPDFKEENLKVKNIFELAPKDMKEIIGIYKEKLLPHVKNIINLLSQEEE